MRERRDSGYYSSYRGRARRRRRRRLLMRKAGLLFLSIGIIGIGCATMSAAAGENSEETVSVNSDQVFSVSQGDAPMVLLPEPTAGPAIPLIVLDPGHGGDDEGCARENVMEKDINLELALALRDNLLEQGYRVLLTREEDEGLSLEQRAQAANEAGADVFVSIHQNACEVEEPTGIETWYSVTNESENSRRLARLIQMYTVQCAEAADRGVQQTEDLYVIRESAMASCLVETGFLSNPQERENLASAEYQKELVEGIAAGIGYYLNPKTMYLTFDDGPSEENTSAVLDILKEYDIKATFFLVGENVERHPEVARRIVEEGHTIGIHCNRHEYDEIYESVDSYLADFEAARDIVYEVTGVEVQLFRFPGGSVNSYNKNVYEEIIVEMTSRGYIYFDWNASLEDAVSKTDPETLIQNAKDTTLGRKKVVMLAHDIVYNTTLCLEELIDAFPEYQMQPLTPEVEPVQFKR